MGKLSCSWENGNLGVHCTEITSHPPPTNTHFCCRQVRWSVMKWEIWHSFLTLKTGEKTSKESIKKCSQKAIVETF